jgi:streptogramin lyase
MNPLLSAVTRYIRRSHRDRGRIRTSRRKARRSRLCLEALESRDVPSALSVADTSAVEGAGLPKFFDRFVPAGSGGLSRPRSLIFGPSADNDGVQDLYIADRNLNAILRYDGATGAFIDTFVAAGSGGLNQPGDLVFGSDGNLYVSSEAGNQVLSYSPSGAFLNVVATGLSTPVGITFGSDGSLYIANSGTNEVLRVNNSVLSTFVSAGSGGLQRPYDVKIGPDGNLYVQSANGVLRYNGQNGAFIDTFAGTVLGQGDGEWEQFGTDGYLYTTARTTPSTLNTSLNRFNATTGAYVDTLSIGRDSWNFMVDPNNIIYYSGNGGANYIERFGHSSVAPFSVTLDAASTSTITVNYSTADGTR